MDDNSISQRTYNKYGNVMQSKNIANPDIESAVNQLDKLMTQLKAKKYIMPDEVKSVVPPVLGKRPAASAKAKPATPVVKAVKKRDLKVESKEATAGRKSARQAAAVAKPIYDEKEIDKIILGTSATNKAESGGAINVMLA